MENQEYIKVKCAECETSLPEEWIEKENDNVCPNCGSENKHIEVGFFDHFSVEKIKESISGKLKDPSYNSKRNPRYEFFEGDDKRNSDGKWMKKIRILDKRNDRYFEQVINPETGVITHECDEPLSKHIDHGQAKFNKEE